jgi:ubiquinone/menaquinone biosynthesis C-methylase UbiE
MAVMRKPHWQAKLEWEGGSYTGMISLVTVGNTPLTGGLFYMTPNADPFDGKLTFVYGYMPTRRKILQLLPRTMKPGAGSYVEHPDIHQIHSSWLKIEVETGTPVHADGEIQSKNERQFYYRVRPACIPVLLQIGMLPAKLLIPLLRQFYRLLYYEFAWSYDLVAWFVSAGQWRRWVSGLLPYLTGEVLLELGHGPGHLQITLAAQGKQIYGVDLSPFMSRQARRRLKKAGQCSRLANSYTQWLPFPAGAFEQIFATFPSEYIFDPGTLAETFRTLKPGGWLLVLPLARVTGSNIHERLSKLLFYLTGQDRPSNDGLHQPASHLLHQAGFTAVEINTIQVSHGEILVVSARKPAHPSDNGATPRTE